MFLVKANRTLWLLHVDSEFHAFLSLNLHSGSRDIKTLLNFPFLDVVSTQDCEKELYGVKKDSQAICLHAAFWYSPRNGAFGLYQGGT